MSNLFWLSEGQFEEIKTLLPDKVRGVLRVDDRRVLSGIVHVIKRGLHWSDWGPDGSDMGEPFGPSLIVNENGGLSD